MDFWKNFTYRIRISNVYFKKEQEFKDCYVTAVNDEDKTFDYHTEEEIEEKSLKILKFRLNRAVDLMNSIFCNGYLSSIEPYFDDEDELKQKEKKNSEK